MEPAELRDVIRENIRSLRKMRSMTQVALAKKLDVTPGFIANIEAGRSAISIDTLAKIAKALGAPPHALLDEKIYSAA